MTLKIKKLGVNFEKSVLGTYEWTLGDTLREKIVSLDEPYDTFSFKCVRTILVLNYEKSVLETYMS